MKTVPLHGKKAAGRVALVDDGDYELVLPYRWYVDEVIRPGRRPRGPYVTADTRDQGRRGHIRMHRLITAWPATDHIDHDGLNNQRSNLRPAGERNRLNLGNSRPRLGYTSAYKGVSWHRQVGKWRASIGAGPGRARHLGLFVSEQDAARAYDAAARVAFGEYACLNFSDAA